MNSHKYLFLDRDGVINKRLPGAYVGSWEAFEILPDALDAIKIFNRHFERIFIITNQAGIAKGLIEANNVEFIHQNLLKELQDIGAHVDRIYYCPHQPSDQCECRKPNPGMALKARADFSDVIFKQSIMVGDSASDLKFGLNLNMQIIEIRGKEEDVDKLAELPTHLAFDTLIDYARFLETL